MIRILAIGTSLVLLATGNVIPGLLIGDAALLSGKGNNGGTGGTFGDGSFDDGQQPTKATSDGMRTRDIDLRNYEREKAAREGKTFIDY